MHIYIKTWTYYCIRLKATITVVDQALALAANKSKQRMNILIFSNILITHEEEIEKKAPMIFMNL